MSCTTWSTTRCGHGSTADGSATVGITALGIVQAGEIYMARPKVVGSAVEQGRSIAVVELAKSIVSVKSPVHGMVVAVNALLADTPELVHRDPYGEGWLARVALADFDCRPRRAAARRSRWSRRWNTRPGCSASSDGKPS
ncbi:MAG: hypothetical protein QM722_23285 [Piscinibacter sp.]